MATKIVEVQQSQAPTNLLVCKHDKCRLLVCNAIGMQECLMETVREKWRDSSVARYCDEPSANSYVEFINSKRVLS